MAKLSHSLLWLAASIAHPAAALPGDVSAVDAVAAKRSEGLSVLSVDIRALPDSPSDREAEWLPRRRNNTIDPMRELLTRANIPDFDAGAYIDRVRDNATALPNIAIAVSGGGYPLRRRAGSSAPSSPTTSPPSLIYNQGSDGSSVWRFDRSHLPWARGSPASPILNTGRLLVDRRRRMSPARVLAGTPSITDFWGRALSYQLINPPDGGPAYTFSSIADTGAVRRTPDTAVPHPGSRTAVRPVSASSPSMPPVYEFNPFELGSFDPTTYGFAPLRYLASNFSNGEIARDGECVRGFDQLGFVMGTSSSLFNAFILQNVTGVAESADIPKFLIESVTNVLDRLDADENDIAQYAPNPFFGWNPTNDSANHESDQLSLVDGGMDLQNIPLHPLIQPFRAVDVIFAVDSSADTTFNWPNGTALRATYDRAGTAIGNGTLFPPVPDAETFVNQRLNQRPTFFGCDANNFTLEDGQSLPPLIVYVPNAPYTAHSNVSTFNPSYPTAQRDAIIRNGFNAATQGNATVDSEWPVCVACAVLSRSLHRGNETVPEACTRCFERYCWDGSTDSASVSSFEPGFIIGSDEKEDAAGIVRASFWGVGVSLAVAALVMW
ncbi:lysophospholipase [Verticillium alfalfae VaMs.102]|uniref:Lysophospholipase n=1 Tax=Verticillium alfalfae (strain VaMs.102 / ATCC MYA-4576 / FGSC 10136) TaxID=526221 RepID=C9SQE2_VERA1|nr:lysophospholipase [Verticillium alfalfae VaMs.102]EEY21067.1 lysophospholipase [Verticillium alfalfae VaMs.102]